jgi:hypothetical protein
VIYPGSTPVGNATLVVANVLTCNKYSHIPLLTCTDAPKHDAEQSRHHGSWQGSKQTPKLACE